MQSLDIISVNLWTILISLINLLLIFIIVKKFLFKPVKKLIADREAAIDKHFSAAKDAETAALESKNAWELKLKGAEEEADAILVDATETAKRRAEQIVSDANTKAEGIVTRAEEEAVLTRKKATDEMKKEIVGVSAAIAEKMLEREINTDDHKSMIDSFIDKIGDGND